MRASLGLMGYSALGAAGAPDLENAPTMVQSKVSAAHGEGQHTVLGPGRAVERPDDARSRIIRANYDMRDCALNHLY